MFLFYKKLRYVRTFCLQKKFECAFAFLLVIFIIDYFWFYAGDELMFKRNHVCAIAAMAAFSMMSFIACGDDVVNTPNPSTEPVADEPSADSVSTKGPSAEEIQKNCQREGLNELCLVVSSPGKVEYFQNGMDINDALKEKMSNHFAGTDISIYVSVDSAGDSWTENNAMPRMSTSSRGLVITTAMNVSLNICPSSVLMRDGGKM